MHLARRRDHGTIQSQVKSKLLSGIEFFFTYWLEVRVLQGLFHGKSFSRVECQEPFQQVNGYIGQNETICLVGENQRRDSIYLMGLHWERVWQMEFVS